MDLKKYCAEIGKTQFFLVNHCRDFPVKFELKKLSLFLGSPESGNSEKSESFLIIEVDCENRTFKAKPDLGENEKLQEGTPAE